MNNESQWWEDPTEFAAFFDTLKSDDAKGLLCYLLVANGRTVNPTYVDWAIRYHEQEGNTNGFSSIVSIVRTYELPLERLQQAVESAMRWRDQYADAYRRYDVMMEAYDHRKTSALERAAQAGYQLTSADGFRAAADGRYEEAYFILKYFPEDDPLAQAEYAWKSHFCKLNTLCEWARSNSPGVYEVLDREERGLMSIWFDSSRTNRWHTWTDPLGTLKMLKDLEAIDTLLEYQSLESNRTKNVLAHYAEDIEMEAPASLLLKHRRLMDLAQEYAYQVGLDWRALKKLVDEYRESHPVE